MKTLNVSVHSGIGGDGFDLSVYDGDDMTYFEKYRYGDNVSYSLRNASENKPYTDDVLKQTIQKYGVDAVSVEAEINVFAGKPVSQPEVDDFVKNHCWDLGDVTVMKGVHLNLADLEALSPHVYGADAMLLNHVNKESVDSHLRSQDVKATQALKGYLAAQDGQETADAIRSIGYTMDGPGNNLFVDIILQTNRAMTEQELESVTGWVSKEGNQMVSSTYHNQEYGSIADIRFNPNGNYRMRELSEDQVVHLKSQNRFPNELPDLELTEKDLSFAEEMSRSGATII